MKSYSKPLLSAVACVWLEAFAVLGFAVFGVVSLRSEAGQSPGPVIALAVLLLIFAAGIGGSGFAMLRGFRTARSFAVTWQIFQAAIGIWLSFNGFAVWGIAVLIITILTFRFLFAAETIAHTDKGLSR